MARSNYDWSISGEARDGKPVCPKCQSINTMPDPECNFNMHFRVCNDCGTPFKWSVAFSVMPLNECTRCGFKWPKQEGELPQTCANPKCRSPYWNKPRTKGVKADQ